eukprot:CAMPEP_0182592782 /NCGR_PEP_ID=MMETSP1324-20130603/76614_1 /TAXON_ID=236786 /ORGANISM="Florenciella sp., Strain RCC1587" /LENGTH=47 /DNA_ID= /DNA_START= /DNA_END= /DNA_ORIENTATION=
MGVIDCCRGCNERFVAACPKLNRYICATLGLITILLFLGVQVVYLSL